jgi:hypothetical protein
MKLSNLMIVKAIVCLVFGIPMLLVPATLMSLYGVTLDSYGMLMARLYGAALLGNLCLTWFCRSDPGSVALRAAVLHLFVYDGLGFIVALVAVVTGLMSALGWSVVAIYLFFTLGYGYFQLMEPRTS